MHKVKMTVSEPMFYCWHSQLYRKQWRIDLASMERRFKPIGSAGPNRVQGRASG